MSPSIARVLLGLATVLFALFGAAFALAPTWSAGQVDLVLSTSTARTDVAAIYGGLELGLAAFLGLCLVQGRLRTGLTAAGLALAGLALVRGVHLFAYGGETLLWASLAAEAAGSVMAFWLTRSVNDAAQPRADR